MKRNYQTEVQEAKADYKKYIKKYPRRDFYSGTITAVFDDAKFKNTYDLICDALKVGIMMGYKAGLKDAKKAEKKKTKKE